jgi:phosphatidylglycerophosphatase C
MTESEATPLTPAPPAPRRVVAAFDFDGTLTNGGSVVPFLIALRGRRTVLATMLGLAPRFFRAALTGGKPADDVKEELFRRLLGGLPLDIVEERSAAFATRHLNRHLRQDARRRMLWHQRQGHHVVIVSASPEVYVRPAGAILGADGAVGTRLAIGGGGLLTGGYEGKNCRGAEKYARLLSHLRAQGMTGGRDEPELWAYGNSRGDLSLLRAADHGVDAGLLGPLGRLRRFPRLAEVLRRAELDPSRW